MQPCRNAQVVKQFGHGPGLFLSGCHPCHASECLRSTPCIYPPIRTPVFPLPVCQSAVIESWALLDACYCEKHYFIVSAV